MRRAYAGEALGLGFHHRAEVVAAVGALLLQVEADRCEVFVAKRLGQQCPVALGTQGVLYGMRGQQRIDTQAAQAGAAGPGERGGVVGHAGADGVEVDVEHAAQQVLAAIDQACLVSTFPERARAMVAGIELAHVLTAKSLHQLADGTRPWWRDQQVHVVVHQHIGVQLASAGKQGFAQKLPIAGPVLSVEETGQAVVAALHDMLWDAGEVDAGLSRHAERVGRAAPVGHQRTHRWWIGGYVTSG